MNDETADKTTEQPTRPADDLLYPNEQLALYTIGRLALEHHWTYKDISPQDNTLNLLVSNMADALDEGLRLMSDTYTLQEYLTDVGVKFRQP